MKFYLFETDEFHPWETDGELATSSETVLENPEDVIWAAEECIEEMMSSVHSYYANPWNHSPGYVPSSPEWKPDVSVQSIAESFTNKLVDNNSKETV